MTAKVEQQNKQQIKCHFPDTISAKQIQCKASYRNTLHPIQVKFKWNENRSRVSSLFLYRGRETAKKKYNFARWHVALVLKENGRRKEREEGAQGCQGWRTGSGAIKLTLKQNMQPAFSLHCRKLTAHKHVHIQNDVCLFTWVSTHWYVYIHTLFVWMVIQSCVDLTIRILTKFAQWSNLNLLKFHAGFNLPNQQRVRPCRPAR